LRLDDDTRDRAQPFQKLAEEALGGLSVAPGLHQDVERLPILILRSPAIAVLAVHGEYDFV
jgi:hypothetical protein